jgi:hypothetical protein
VVSGRQREGVVPIWAESSTASSTSYGLIAGLVAGIAVGDALGRGGRLRTDRTSFHER